MFYLPEVRPYSGNISTEVINWMLDELINSLKIHRALNSWIRNILVFRAFMCQSQLLCYCALLRKLRKFTSFVMALVFIGSEYILDGRYVADWNTDDLKFSVGALWIGCLTNLFSTVSLKHVLHTTLFFQSVPNLVSQVISTLESTIL